MSWYPDTHWKTANDVKRQGLEARAAYYRALQNRLVEDRHFEEAAHARGFARDTERELRHMDGLCGECGRPRVRP